MTPRAVLELLRTEIESLQDGARSSVYGYKYGDMSVLDGNGNYPDDYYEAKERLEAYGRILARNELLGLDESQIDALGLDAEGLLRRFSESISREYPGARDPISVVLSDLRRGIHGTT